MIDDIDKGIRILNFTVDSVVIVVVFSIIHYLLYSNDPVGVFYLVYFSYYLTFEFVSGQALGKIITNTEVINSKGSTPNFGKILLRTILRLIPIDGYSYLFGQDQGGHDIMSRTRLRRR